MNEWIVILCGMAALGIFYLLFCWKKIDKDLFLAAAELIPEAEEVFIDRVKSGEEKKKWVVEHLMEMIPKLFRKIFTAENLGSVVQFIFDQIVRFSGVK